jgi:hypothetical protein
VVHEPSPQVAEAARCVACDAVLVGRFCHECGQQRVYQRLTTKDFAGEFARRVLRFDKAFVATLWRAVREPGRLTHDYLAGRRRGILDPIFYFVGTVFIQFLIVALAHMLAMLFQRTAIFDTLGTVGGMVALKIVVILIAAGVWRLIERDGQHTVAEIAVFAVYCFGTLGLLWAVLPLLELLLFLPLSTYRLETVGFVLLIAIVYLTLGIRDFAGRSVLRSAASAILVLVLGYGLLVLVLGVGRSIEFMAPLLGAP